ncbi:putative guanine nucleotide-exchange factor Sed4p [Diutina catenulata]
MSHKHSGLLDVGYPVYGAKFVNNNTLVVAGGGGNGNHGIPNKITVIKSSFKVKEANRRLQRFREITLPADEDSPQCLDIARDSVDDNGEYSVFMGCNQSPQLISSMNINNNVRKYRFTADEHLRFVDAAQLEEAASEPGVYPRVVRLAPGCQLGGFMTSKIPSHILLFSPESLEVVALVQSDTEIKDFVLSPDGQKVVFVTSSQVVVATRQGQVVSTHPVDGLQLRKVRFVSDDTVLIAAAQPKKGAVLVTWSLASNKVLKRKVVSTKFNNITAIDVHPETNTVAVAGNDLSLVTVRLSDLGTIKHYAKLHPFAITAVAFNPSGTQLASVSAANKVHVFSLPAKYSRGGGSTIGTIFNYLFTIVLMAAVAIGLQRAHETGQLEVWMGEASHYGKIGAAHAVEYGGIAAEMARKYGDQGYSMVRSKIDDYQSAQAEKKASAAALADLTAKSDIMSETTADPQTETQSTYHEANREGYQPVEQVVEQPVEQKQEQPVEQPVVEQVKEQVEQPVEQVKEQVVEAKEQVQDAASQGYNQAQEAVDHAQQQAREMAGHAQEQAAEAASQVYDQAQDVAGHAHEQVAEAAGQAQDAAEPVVEQINEAQPAEHAKEAIESVVEQVKQAAEPVVEQVQSAAEPVVEQVQNVVEPVVERAQEAAEPVVEAAAPVAEQVQDAAQTVVEQATEAAGSVVEQAQEVVEPVVEQAREAAEPVVEAAESVVEAAEPVVEQASESVQSVAEAAAEAAAEATEAVVDAAEPVVEAAKQAPEPVEAAQEVVEEASSVVVEATEAATEAAEPVAEQAAEKAQEVASEAPIAEMLHKVESAVAEELGDAGPASAIESVVEQAAEAMGIHEESQEPLDTPAAAGEVPVHPEGQAVHMDAPQGVDMGAAAAMAAMAAHEVVDEVQDAKHTVADAAESVVEAVSEGVAGAAHHAESAVSEVVDAVKSHEHAPEAHDAQPVTSIESEAAPVDAPVNHEQVVEEVVEPAVGHDEL